MNSNDAERFVRAASLLFVLRGDISSKKANYRLRQAASKANVQRKTSVRKATHR